MYHIIHNIYTYINTNTTKDCINPTPIIYLIFIYQYTLGLPPIYTFKMQKYLHKMY